MIATKGDFHNGHCRKLTLSSESNDDRLTSLAHVARDYDVPRLFFQLAAAVARTPGIHQHLRDEAREVLARAGVEA